jgi:hypothetical protein
MDTFIGDTIVMFGINQVFRTKKGFSPLYCSGSVYIPAKKIHLFSKIDPGLRR